MEGTTLECIKERCRYFIQHTFYQSAFKCEFDTFSSYPKDSTVECKITKEISDMESTLKGLKNYEKYIEKTNGGIV
jgi:hypothetical protein